MKKSQVLTVLNEMISVLDQGVPTLPPHSKVAGEKTLELVKWTREAVTQIDSLD